MAFSRTYYRVAEHLFAVECSDSALLACMTNYLPFAVEINNNDNIDNISRQSYGEADRSNESEIRTPCRDKENNTTPSYTTLHHTTQPYTTLHHTTPSYTTLHHTTPFPDEMGEMEITLEANPGDITPEKARAWREMGFNRLSIGIQSFDDDLLQLIGRRHTAQEALQAVAIAQATGFDNISIDLMYALPSQTMEQWQKDVQLALSLGIQHISTYGLIYEEGTALTKLLMDNRLQPVDEELEMRMYDYLVGQFTANGFLHYEVSNFALPGRHSRHNSSYWNDTPYLGLGAAAHSYDGLHRQWNIADLDGYIRQALAHQLSPEIEHLSDEDRHTERVMLGLRTSQGVAKADIDMHKAKPYLEQGLLEDKGERVVATTQGFHILNRIIEDLV